MPDSAIGSEQARKFVYVVRPTTPWSQKYVTLGQLVRGRPRDQERSRRRRSRDRERPDARASPGIKVTPQTGATAPRSRRRDRNGAEIRRRACRFRISSSTGRFSRRVLSIVFIILGGVAFLRLPIAQYPEIAPPVINITGQYPGASAETVADTVVAPIEQQVNGVEGMLYISSNSTADGRFSISVTFDLGINLDIAQVQVQNRVATATPRLAAGGAADRRHGREELARHPDGGEPVFAGPVARPDLSDQLRQSADQGRADAPRWRRLDHGVRRARFRDAGLARSEPPAVAEPDGAGRDRGACRGRTSRSRPAC